MGVKGVPAMNNAHTSSYSALKKSTLHMRKAKSSKGLFCRCHEKQHIAYLPPLAAAGALPRCLSPFLSAAGWCFFPFAKGLFLASALAFLLARLAAFFALAALVGEGGALALSVPFCFRAAAICRR